MPVWGGRVGSRQKTLFWTSNRSHLTQTDLCRQPNPYGTTSTSAPCLALLAQRVQGERIHAAEGVVVFFHGTCTTTVETTSGNEASEPGRASVHSTAAAVFEPRTRVSVILMAKGVVVAVRTERMRGVYLCYSLYRSSFLSASARAGR